MNLHVRLEKKKIGSFYTPPNLAELIVDEVLCGWVSKSAGAQVDSFEDLQYLSRRDRTATLAALKQVTIVDPAVGDGAFLLAAARWLEGARFELDDRVSQLDRRREIVENSLFGVDIVADAAMECINALNQWVSETGNPANPLSLNIREGNALVGPVHKKASPLSESENTRSFHWASEFPDVFNHGDGFDVVIGNPPYGNILSQTEREHILSSYEVSVGGGRTGTWNAAAHFIVRASMILGKGGSLGFLVPNSILRVTQFQKIRDFLLGRLQLRKIVDEGSPFDNVTLEMVSVFCEADIHTSPESVQVDSRRPGHYQRNSVPKDVLESGRIFPIYHDAIHAELLKSAQREMLSATRGRDIPKSHVSEERGPRFSIPYLTSGRSVKRYYIDSDYVTFTDDWFKQDSGLMHSYNSELLVATKNYRYPRCVIKPKGFLHGGGIVRIDSPEELDYRALGLILNSRLVRYVCKRYLTNYSELTTCLNTGIMNDLPMRIPEDQEIFRTVFNVLSRLHSPDRPSNPNLISFFERLGNALVYELFFGGDELQRSVLDCLDGESGNTPERLHVLLDTPFQRRIIRHIFRADHVKTIERHQ